MAKRPERIRVDGGYFNVFNSISRGRMQNYGAEMMSGNYYMDQRVLVSAYMHNGYARKLCDKPAEEMTRAGFKLKDMTDDENQKIQAKLEELDYTRKVTDALKWSRAFGGALIVVGIKDGSALDEPVNEAAVEDVEFLRVYDRYEAYPSSYYNDPADKNFGRIERWTISPKGEQIPQYNVHESRVLIFDGESVPNDVRFSNHGWGSSVIQYCFSQLNRLDNSHKWGNLLLERMQQAVHKVPNLSDELRTEQGEADFVKRVAVVDKVRSSLNTIAIDALEDYTVQSSSVTGVSDLIDRFAEALSSVSDIPMFILMGKSMGGLSNGDTNKEAWLAKVVGEQNVKLRKPTDRLITLINLADSKGSSDGGDYTIEFNPLFTLSEEKQAEVDNKCADTKKKTMETFKGYVDMQVMEQDEVREDIREEYDLEGDAPEPKEDPGSGTTVLNPGQAIVPNQPGQINPAIKAT